MFDPFVVRTFNLDLDPADWDTIRFDTTNEIEVPAMFRADAESQILVSVRMKSSRALPCPTPADSVLESRLDALMELDAMLAQGAIDAFVDNRDALFSHGKNFFFADFDHSGLKRRFIPWDLDAVFRSTSARRSTAPRPRR